mgnify:CR=1 FL=1
MARRRFSPLDRVLGRIDDLDAQNLAILARRLERERDLMETVLDTLREGVIVLSHDGAIEYANASAVRLLGVSSEAAAGAELRRLSPDIAQALELPETVGALTRELEVRYPEPRLLALRLTRVGDQQGAERSRRVLERSRPFMVASAARSRFSYFAGMPSRPPGRPPSVR